MVVVAFVIDTFVAVRPVELAVTAPFPKLSEPEVVRPLVFVVVALVVEE